MTFKANQAVSVQLSRTQFEAGKFVAVTRGGKIKVLFSDNTYDLFPATKVKAAMPKREKRAVVEDALTKMQRKAGTDPEEHVGAWDTAEVRKAVATFGKRAKMTGKPYHEIRNAYEAKHGKIPKLNASDRAQIVRETRDAEAALMNAAESNARKPGAKQHPAIKSVTFTPAASAGRVTHYLHQVNVALLTGTVKRLQTHLVYVLDGRLAALGTKGADPKPATIAQLAEWKKIVLAKCDAKGGVPIFLNGMSDAALLETLVSKVYRA